MRFSAIQYAADLLVAVIIEHQVRMSTRTFMPALDTILVLSNGCGNYALSCGAVSVGGSR